MILFIIIFILSILAMFFMLAFQAWKIEKSYISINQNKNNFIPYIPFRHVEKNMLYLTKHIIQWIVVVVVKYWFVLYTKTKTLIKVKWPELYSFIRRKISGEEKPVKPSFISRAVLESKIKIKRVKEKVIREHNKKNFDINKNMPL